MTIVNNFPKDNNQTNQQTSDYLYAIFYVLEVPLVFLCALIIYKRIQNYEKEAFIILTSIFLVLSSVVRLIYFSIWLSNDGMMDLQIFMMTSNSILLFAADLAFATKYFRMSRTSEKTFIIAKLEWLC